MSTVSNSDCMAFLATLEDASVDSCVTDPPYELGFMGKKWDNTGIANKVEMWAEVLRVLKPGAHLLAFSGTRTYHRMVCAIEDAGFEIRDQIGWLYGSGFPKSLDVGKAIDKAAGATRKEVATGKPQKRMIPGADQDKTGSWVKDNGREFVPTTSAPATEAATQWDGWGTALKPAWEPIVVARKPLDGTVAVNVLQWGCGGLNIDGCRIEGAKPDTTRGTSGSGWGMESQGRIVDDGKGRWPANIIHDGSEEVLIAFDQFGEKTSGRLEHWHADGGKTKNCLGKFKGRAIPEQGFGGTSGSAARFFYSAKAAGDEREGNNHPTVKPLALMRYLVRLVTPSGGTVLDHFAGSGSTLIAAKQEGFSYLGCDMEAEHVAIINERLAKELL